MDHAKISFIFKQRCWMKSCLRQLFGVDGSFSLPWSLDEYTRWCTSIYFYIC